ncbi:MAG: sirohydrochlorin chelatase, partial [Pseudomonadota bacterium]
TLADKLPAYMPDGWDMEYGYLEFANPVIRDGLDKLRENGCERILAVPGMLFAAMHSKNDIPTVLNTYAAKHGLAVSYGRELGVDPKMVAAAGARIEEALSAAGGNVSRHDTCLVVIGRGASDPDANANVAKIARLLHEGMGFGWCEVGYSGVTFPLVEPCLQHAAKLGYKRIVVFPYFLFSGILIDRIYGFTDQVAAEHPEIEFVKAGYLGDHPKVLETFAERVLEQDSDEGIANCGTCAYRTQILSLEDGSHTHITPHERAATAATAARDGKGHPAFAAVPPATCVMCKYRTAVLGFEAEVGAVQESHHHHVEGQGASAPGSNVADCTHCDTFCTGVCRLEMVHSHHHHHHHDHSHSHPHAHDHAHTHDHHHHAPYPQAKHPHGPESARKSKRKDKRTAA